MLGNVVAPVELLEEVRLYRFRYAAAGIEDRDLHARSTAPAAHQDASPIGVAQGIAQQVAQDVLDQVDIARHHCRAGHKAQPNAFVASRRRELQVQLLKQVHNRERFNSDVRRIGVKL